MVDSRACTAGLGVDHQTGKGKHMAQGKQKQRIRPTIPALERAILKRKQTAQTLQAKFIWDDHIPSRLKRLARAGRIVIQVERNPKNHGKVFVYYPPGHKEIGKAGTTILKV